MHVRLGMLLVCHETCAIAAVRMLWAGRVSLVLLKRSGTGNLLHNLHHLLLILVVILCILIVNGGVQFAEALHLLDEVAWNLRGELCLESELLGWPLNVLQLLADGLLRALSGLDSGDIWLQITRGRHH